MGLMAVVMVSILVMVMMIRVMMVQWIVKIVEAVVMKVIGVMMMVMILFRITTKKLCIRMSFRPRQVEVVLQDIPNSPFDFVPKVGWVTSLIYHVFYRCLIWLWEMVLQRESRKEWGSIGNLPSLTSLFVNLVNFSRGAINELLNLKTTFQAVVKSLFVVFANTADVELRSCLDNCQGIIEKTAII